MRFLSLITCLSVTFALTGCEQIASVDRTKIPAGNGGESGSGGTAGTTGGSAGEAGTAGNGGSAAGTGGGGTGGTAGTAGTGGGGTGGGGTGGGGTGGGGTGGGGTGGGGTAGTGGGGTGGSGGCGSPSDCPAPQSPCQEATCENSTCGTSNLPVGTMLTDPTAGDCKTQACDANGQAVTVDSDTDIEDDANDCTDDTCSGGAPVHTAVALNKSCATNNGAFCSDPSGPNPGVCVECNDGSQCGSNVCQAGACQDASCGDMVQNPGETDVDCGGSCGPCDDNLKCLVDADCTSSVCEGNPLKCQAPTCMDGTKNGDETDADCGGLICNKCNTDQACIGPDDCASGVCQGLKCQAAQCDDGVKNGSESAADCGGSCPNDCDVGDTCNSNNDCITKVCNVTCQQATCSDNATNGTETDTDCGGAMCPKCLNGDSCLVGSDCQSGLCVGLVCQAQPTCNDMTPNGNETDVDCGGPDCPDCANNKACNSNSDCISAYCNPTGHCENLNGCDITTATDMTGSSMVSVAFDNGNFTYDPKCLKVAQGTVITFNGNFSSHPLLGGVVTGGAEIPAGSGPFVPVTNTGMTADFTMTTTGTFPYYCVPHGTLGMNGVVFVVP